MRQADRSTPGSAAELQAQTVEYVRARYSPDDRLEPTTAYYSRDEVAGPLRTAPGQEDTQEVHQTLMRKVRETEGVIKDTTSENNP
jgi:hypothetical protein